MNELLEEKMKVVLNLIRTNSSASDALNIAQAFNYLTRAQLALNGESGVEQEAHIGSKTTKKSGTGA